MLLNKYFDITTEGKLIIEMTNLRSILDKTGKNIKDLDTEKPLELIAFNNIMEKRSNNDQNFNIDCQVFLQEKIKKCFEIGYQDPETCTTKYLIEYLADCAPNLDDYFI